MNEITSKQVLQTLVMLTCIFGAQVANAGATINFGEDKYISAGFGMRASGVYNDGGSPDSKENISLDSARIYLSGSLNKYVKGMLNTEKSIAGEGFQPIDANVQISITPELTVWAGRFLSPSDRANMAGPYYSLGGGYWSGIASRYGYNGGYIGRDDGVALVGTAFGSVISYSAGVFEGNTTFNITGAKGYKDPAYNGTRSKDAFMYAGRVQVDFWDAEPGYYGTGNYLGSKNILAIGLAARTQKYGAVSATATGDYSSYSIDFLMEKMGVGPGAVSVEAAYYDYDTDGVFLGEQGKAYSAGTGYIFKEPVGWGKVQPFVRYQKFNSDALTNSEIKKYDVGVAYIISGYNAQLTAAYSDTKVSGASGVNAFNLAMQFQF